MADTVIRNRAQIESLSRQLGEIDSQLHALTPGDVDAVIGPDGKSFLLRQSQIKLLQSEDELRDLAQQLEQERSKLVAAQAVAKIGSWSVDAVSRMVECSLEMYRIVEADASPRHHDWFLALVHPDDRERVVHKLQRSFDEDDDQILEHRLLLPGGIVKFVEQRWQVERDPSGKAIRAFGTCQDTTARRCADEALRRSQAQLSMATRLSRIGAWSLTVDSPNVWWSDEVCAVHEVEPGTSPSVETAIEFYSPEWRPVIRQAVLACMENGTAFDEELELISARGRRVWIRTIGEAIRDSSGRVVRIQGALQDLSDRKRTENEVRRLAKRLTTTLESLTVSFLSVDHEWRITYFNVEAERTLGRRREEVLGRDLWQELPQLVGSEFEPAFRLAAANGESQLREGKLPSSEQWFRVTIYPSEEGVAVLMRDITGEHAAEAALRQLNLELESRVRARTAELDAAREEAESASRAKSSFLAAVSHEIRTPMNGVIGLIDVLSQSNLQPPQVEMVRLVRDSAESLLSIIDDILDFSKIEAGKLQIERTPIQLREIVEKVGGLLASVARGRKVALTVFVDPDLPDTVVGDELRLRQILINLLGNAIKFSSGLDRVGRVSLKVGRVEVLSPGDTIEVTVSDNGVGIDPKTLGRLFQPFSQADASTTRRFGGTGLGLAITKMLVELQGGRISVESILGEGSTFRVKLPLQPVASTGPAAIERPLSGLQCAIIGADDELAADLSSYLSHAGAKVQRSRRASPREVQESEGRIWLILPDVSEDHRRALRSMGGTRIIALRFGNNAAAAIDKEAEAWLDLDTLTRGSLLRSVAAAAGRSSISPADSGALRAPEAAEPLSAAGSLVAPVLVAEDIETNREVIQRQLKLLGLDAEMTENGQEALERWRSGNFNLVLTDIRMPIMDGYALASAIREEEMGRWRTCIIALTADALPEEEGKCLAAGMDGYLVKPITSSRLKTIIEKSLAARERAMAGETRVAVSAAGPVNLEVLKGLIGDDPAGIAAVLDKFRINSDRLSAEIERAVESDLSAVVDIAHRLKSGAFSIGAKRLGELCVELERAGRGGKKDQLKVLLSQFRTQMQAVREFIDSAT